MASDDGPGIGRLVILLGIFAIVGIPIVAVLWDAVNHVAAGDLGRLVVAVPTAAVFVVFLIVLAGRIRRLE
jgi:hypothetical protein